MNEDCIFICVGDKGSGMSYTSLKLTDHIDPNFSVDEVIFSPQKFLKLIKGDKIK